ncbi:MAG: MBL fold metallo-hydrolase [Clostridia bacterium]|nr:MBL fold metallo-hydrolase [Clostridia bacterium]
MKKILLYLLVFTLILSTVFACISCSSENVDTDTDDTTAPVEEKNPITVFENNAYNIVIVYPHDAPNLIEDTAFSFSAYLLQSTGGVYPQVVSDREYKDMDTSDMSMILIGKTSISGVESTFENTYYGTAYTRISGNKYQVVINDKEESLLFLNKAKALLGNSTLSSIIFDESWEFSVANNTALNVLPLYNDCFAEETVDCGDGAYMKVIPDTDKDGFEAYIEKATQAGYEIYTRTEIGDNSFATLTTDGYVMNAMYLPVRNEARLIIEPEEITTLPKLESENKYEAICSSSVTQLGLENRVEDCQYGMCYILKLADGRFVVIDGGVNADYILERFLKTIKELAEDPDNITIATWFLTHMHGDHIGLLERILATPEVDLNINQIIYNAPERDFFIETESEYFLTRVNTFIDTINEKGFEVVKAHPGQIFHLANMKFTIYGTAEMFSLEDTSVFNNSCLLIHVATEGQTILFPGDSGERESENMIELYGKHLKADILQLVHHGYSGADTSYYELVDPQILLWPLALYDYEIGPKMVKDRDINEYFFREEGISLKEMYVAGSTNVTLPLPYDKVTPAN